MNKQMKIIAVIVVVLLVVIGITATLNKGNVEEKKALNDDAIFIVKEKGVEIKSYTMSEIQALGEVTIKAIKDTSNSDPKEYEYIGVPLIEIYKDAGVDIKENDIILNMAADGYAVALGAEKVLDPENVFLTYQVDGEMIGTREEGGIGPYLIIVAKDKFSQYWCKYALSTEVQ